MLIDNIFHSLFTSSNYFGTVFTHLKTEYFYDKPDRLLFESMQRYHAKYKKQGTYSNIKLLIDTDLEITEDDTNAIYEKIDLLKTVEKVTDEELLINKTEEWCKNRALELAILASVEIIQDKDQPNKGECENKIKDALSVQFEVKIGHDYIKDALDRMRWYYDNEETIPLDIEALNQAMGGGLRRKAIAVFIAPPKRGKSLWMTHCAASLVRSGKHVLYLTCELSEKMVSKRIDANLLNIPMNELNDKLDKSKFKDGFKALCKKTHGDLVIKECPSVNATQVRRLLRELAQKKNFKPDVIILDYINICTSASLNSSMMGNTNLYVGRIVMEMRDLAVDENIAMLSAVQNNRGAVKKNTDTGMDDIADAFSIAMNVDWGGSIIQDDELRTARKYLLKTVLTRWEENTNEIYTLGVEYDKMRLKDLPKEDREIPLHLKDQLAFEAQKQNQKDKAAMFDYGTDE